MASGSLPPGFPTTEVNGGYYWDGGLFENTPLSPALNRLEELDKEKKELVVVELFPSQSPIPGDVADVVNPFYSCGTQIALSWMQRSSEVQQLHCPSGRLDYYGGHRAGRGYRRLRALLLEAP